MPKPSQKRATIKTQSTPALAPSSFTLTNGPGPQLLGTSQTTTTNTTTTNGIPQMVNNIAPNLMSLQPTPGNSLSGILPSQTPLQQIPNRMALNTQTPLLPFSTNNNHNPNAPTPPLNQTSLQQISLPNQGPVLGGAMQQTPQNSGTTPRYIRLALFCITQLPNTRSQVQEIITRKDFPDAQKEEAIRKVIQEHQK